MLAMRVRLLALLVVFLVPACTGALEAEVRALRKALAELRRAQSAQRVRHEEVSNRVAVLEEELIRRPAPAAAGAPATVPMPAPGPAGPEDSPPPLPVVRMKREVPAAVDPRPREVSDLAPKPLYARGLAAFRRGDLPECLAVFRAFTQRFPDHSLADNALYWSGRALAKQGDYPGAIAAYEALLRRYPTGNKVPDALVALADALAQTGKASDARKTLARVVRTFPASDAAKDAARRLREMKP
jgi:tol-pal system protein YbgF